MPLGNETAQDKGGKDVAGGGCLSVRGWGKEKELWTYLCSGVMVMEVILGLGLDGLMSEDGFDVIM